MSIEFTDDYLDEYFIDNLKSLLLDFSNSGNTQDFNNFFFYIHNTNKHEKELIENIWALFTEYLFVHNDTYPAPVYINGKAKIKLYDTSNSKEINHCLDEGYILLDDFGLAIENSDYIKSWGNKIMKMVYSIKEFSPVIYAENPQEEQ